MKVGILTFHRAHNYGAVLQCYALQEVIRSMGHDVEVIDYRQPFIEKDYKVFDFASFVRGALARPKSALDYIKRDYPVNKIAKRNFADFRDKYLTLSQVCVNSIPTDYDTYVIGSDQLWGNCLGGTIDPFYFGRFPHKEKSRVIGYAISSKVSALNLFGWKKLQELVCYMDSISFREQKVADLFRKNLKLDVHIDLDPTLLTTKENWRTIVDDKWSKREYVLVYYVKRGFGEYAHQELLSKAQKIAQAQNCEVIDISTKRFSVQDFVSLFAFAKCVITTSFHATAFSIIFNTPIYSMKLHDGNDDRYVHLMESLGMSKQLIEMDEEVDHVPSIDYKAINDLLAQLRKPSLDYLYLELSKICKK